MYFEWKESYCVNFNEIDKQHRKLFEIGSRVSNLVLAKDSSNHYDEMMEILQQLKDYTVYHFSYEEEQMERCGFEGLEGHKMEHAFMIRKLNRLSKKDIDKNQKEAILELISFVSDWITGHIMKTDMRYRESLSSL